MALTDILMLILAVFGAVCALVVPITAAALFIDWWVSNGR